MKKSALQTARASYQPKLPEAIKNGVTIVEGKATQIGRASCRERV